MVVAGEESYDSGYIAADSTDGETDDAEVDYGKWIWDPEINDWYWIYFADSDDAESSSSNEGYEDGENEDQDSSDEEVQWYQYGNDDDDDGKEGEDTDSEETNVTAYAEQVYQTTSREQTLIVFDWDDTILPTTHLHEKLGSDPSADDLSRSLSSELSALEEQLIEILILARTLGKVKIITNAGEGWAESSCQSFMPQLYNFLVENGIPIISARSKFEYEFQGDQWQYKTKAFAQEVHKMLSGEYNTESRFVSIGDSEFEHHAARRLKNIMPERCIKIVKLNENYTPSSIRGQLEHLHFNLGSIVARDEHLDQYVQNIG